MPKLTPEGLDATITGVERDRTESSLQRKRERALLAQIMELEKKVEILTEIDSVQVAQPDWHQPPKQSGTRNRGIANLLLSDLHLDEVVDIKEMRGKNKYDRKIARKRLERLGRKTIEMARDYVSGVSYDGLTIWPNGDMFPGNIHDELRRTNDSVDIIDSVDYWVDPMCAMLCMEADHFGKVHVVVSGGGNHGRNDKKPPAKGATRSNYDWLFWRIIYRELKGDKRFTWNIAESLDVRATQYKTRFLLQHGDDFKGGDQIAGAVRPVMMGDYRTLIMEVTDGEPYDMLLVGHFHQYTTLPRAIINGSLVGYDEWVKRKKFRPEPPKQAFWITTPEHGPSFHLPILAGDRRSEGW